MSLGPNVIDKYYGNLPQSELFQGLKHYNKLTWYLNIPVCNTIMLLCKAYHCNLMSFHSNYCGCYYFMTQNDGIKQ